MSLAAWTELIAASAKELHLEIMRKEAAPSGLRGMDDAVYKVRGINLERRLSVPPCHQDFDRFGGGA